MRWTREDSHECLVLLINQAICILIVLWIIGYFD